MLITLLTPAAGKRLIAKALVRHEVIRRGMTEGMVVIIAGTTTGYVAEELLRETRQSEGFDRLRFMRGVTLPPCVPLTPTGRRPDESGFHGDVILSKGSWIRGRTIFDVVDDLKEGDVILKGANAVNLAQRQAATMIGHEKGGTTVAALQAVVGRRVRLIVPVGVEKRVYSDLIPLAAKVNSPGAQGPRLLPMPGEPFTELDAIHTLSGAMAELVGAGGVGGAEGAVWLGIHGSEKEVASAKEWIHAVESEPLFRLF